MSGALTDKLGRTFNSANPNVARVTTPRSIGVWDLDCDNLLGWPDATQTVVHFSTYRLDATDPTQIEAGTQTDWIGLVTGNTINSMTRITGASDAGNANGDVVEMNPTAKWADNLIQAILNHANQDGTLKDNVVGTSVINDLAVTAAKIANGAATTLKIGDAAITQAKIDYTSVDVYSTTETDTGRKWVDGRAIYRKVLRGQKTIAASQTNIIAHGISGLTTSMEIVSIQGGFKLSASSVAGGGMQTLYYHETSGLIAHVTSVDNTNVVIAAGFAWGDTYYSIILEYVK